ncbi:MRG domain-containing protein [Aphelenchoides besseyi]|nr:MRG domain-containing protein [Aphelenchoides besseyi]
MTRFCACIKAPCSTKLKSLPSEHLQRLAKKNFKFIIRIGTNDMMSLFRSVRRPLVSNRTLKRRQTKQKMHNVKRQVARKKKRTNPDVSVTPGTATSSRSSTPYDSSNKRIHARGSSTHDLNSSSAKRARRLNTGTPTGGQLNSTQSPKNIAPPPTVETPDLKAEYLRQFPDVFRQILKDDKKAFATGRLTVIPAKITVNEILNDYKESLQSFPENGRLHVEYNNGDSLSQTSPVLLSLAVDGLRDYFNCALRSSLLYKGEWSVYDDLKARESTLQDASNSSYLRVFNASAHYGVIHLIRLLSKLTTIHDAIGLSPEVCDAVEANIFDFSKFLEKKITDYYSLDDEYVTAAENGESSSVCNTRLRY